MKHINPIPRFPQQMKRNSNKHSKFIKSIYGERNKNSIRGIYKITHKKNAKFYIGSSYDIEKRWQVHKFELENKCHSNSRLQGDYNFDKDCFDFEVLLKVGKSTRRLKIYELEQEYIDNLKPTYNVQLTVVIPPELKKKVKAEVGVKKVKILKEKETDVIYDSRGVKIKGARQKRNIKPSKYQKVRISDNDIKRMRKKYKLKQAKKNGK